MSPEYAWTGTFSEKSDIYAFGVLQLEIISGKKISSYSCGEEGKNLVEYVRHFLLPPSVPKTIFIMQKTSLKIILSPKKNTFLWVSFLNYMSGMGLLVQEWWSGSIRSRHFSLVFSS